MSAESEAIERIQSGLFHLQRGLAPLVETRMKAAYGPAWPDHVTRARGAAQTGALDVYALLKTIIARWSDIFCDAFTLGDRHKARAFVSLALEARNSVAHHVGELRDSEALRYLDAMYELLKLANAPASETAELARLYGRQRRSGMTLERQTQDSATSPARGPDTLQKGHTNQRTRAHVRGDSSASGEPPDGSRWCPTRTGRAKFRVLGSVANGAELWPGKMPYPIKFPKQFMSQMLDHFQIGEFPVGGKFDDPGHGSLGEYIQQRLQIKTNPAVYLAALLVDEGYAESTRRGYIRLRPKSAWPPAGDFAVSVRP